MTTRDADVVTVIKDAVRDIVEELGLVTKKDLKYLPTKDEFYTETLKIYKRFDNIETELKVINNRQSSHSDKIENLEKIHPHNKHYLGTTAD